MAIDILLVASVILLCVLLNRFTQRLGMPVLLLFILLGILFGTDGLFKIEFDNYKLAEYICTVALIFIMFYGGFGTNWKEAKPVAVKATLLATLGVFFTAAITGVACYYNFDIGLLESLLIGAVISSTDAASVFSILRSKKLGLKDHTDSMLEIESGSNDPTSYMLTIIILTIMQSGITTGSILQLVATQFIFGILFGVVIGFGASFIMRKFNFVTDGFDMAFITAVALLSYASASALDGNGYLSAYLAGIILGNQRLANQKKLVHFFDGVTGLVQMLIFFLLGLLATPSKIPDIFPLALGVMFILTFIARPISIFAILTPFRSSIPQQLLVSFAGLRGAASIVFAIMATVSPAVLGNDIFHIVFCIVLLSIAFQGSLLPLSAKVLNMTDKNINVLKTFSDYSEDVDLQFIKLNIHSSHEWVDKAIKNITLPPETLIVVILRDGVKIKPNGNTVIHANDIAILTAHKYSDDEAISFREHKIDSGSEWIGKVKQNFSVNSDELVVMIIRKDKTILPKGGTEIEENDTLVIYSETA